MSASNSSLDRIFDEASSLPSEDQRRLITRLEEALRHKPPPERSWRDLIGTLPHPALGEDAQAWVTRSRREDDEKRLGRRLADDESR